MTDPLSGSQSSASQKRETIELLELKATWMRKAIKREQVQLPLEARARFGLAGWLLLPLSLFFFAVARKLLGDMFGNAAGPNAPIIGPLVMVAILTIVALLSVGAFLTLVVDYKTSGPLITLDHRGLWDRRSLDRIILWSEVSHAKILHGGKFGESCDAVRLQLRHGVEARHNPLRLGALTSAWFRGRRELIIPVSSLDLPGQRLALAIVTLVKANGGDIGSQ
jgi:hypothetical protein